MMPRCDECGAGVCLVGAAELPVLVREDLREEVAQAARDFGPGAFGKVCHDCGAVTLCALDMDWLG